jgi:hypothetical protein
MVAFYVVLTAGTLLTAAYLAVAFQELQRTRDAVLVVAGEGPAVFERQGQRFSRVAGAGVLVSTTLLVLASIHGVFWYLFPLLAIGSALAVALAVLVDRAVTTRSAASPHKRSPR